MDGGEAYRSVKDHVHALARQCGRNPDDISLIAVSKTRSIEEMMPIYQAGCRDFGESRVQESLEKIPLMPQDIRWHLIGSLQANKIKKVIGHFALIHSVDSIELAKKISEYSIDAHVITAILLQVNTSGEGTKHGFSPEAFIQQIREVFALEGIEVRGLMTMAPLTKDTNVIWQCFSLLRHLRDEVRRWDGVPDSFNDLSMGMSHDYPIAVEEGATLLRIGSALFP